MYVCCVYVLRGIISFFSISNNGNGTIRNAIQWCHCHAFIMPRNLQSWIISFIYCSEEMAFQRRKKNNNFSILSRYYPSLCCNICLQAPTTDAFNIHFFWLWLFLHAILFSFYSLYLLWLWLFPFIRCYFLKLYSQGNRKKRVSCHFNIVYHSPKRIFRGAHVFPGRHRHRRLRRLFFSRYNVAVFPFLFVFKRSSCTFFVPLVKILIVSW